MANREPILVEWEAFARTCAPAGTAMDIAALRDHADEMLSVIASDLDTPQDSAEQSAKSKGDAPDEADGQTTAAEEHGAGRAESGFRVEQMVAEYRSLRASVIRLWTKAQGALGVDDLEDLTRFNEAIDQSLAESVTRYELDLEHSKEMFLAILGHDLRTPIGAVNTAAKFMLETGELREPHLTLTTRIASSSSRMNHLVGDLLDFTRSRLGGGIPIVRTPTSMEKIVRDVGHEIEAAHPDRTVKVTSDGPQDGEWDCPRITQAVTNLIGNAIEHGAERTTVGVDVRGTEQDVTIAIHNHGAAIPADQINGIFNPMKRQGAVSASAKGSSGNLGLGLYIADRIVHAHQGSIGVVSSEADGTTFTVGLPRRAVVAAAPAPMATSAPAPGRASKNGQ